MDQLLIIALIGKSSVQTCSNAYISKGLPCSEAFIYEFFRFTCIQQCYIYNSIISSSNVLIKYKKFICIIHFTYNRKIIYIFDGGMLYVASFPPTASSYLLVPQDLKLAKPCPVLRRTNVKRSI